MVHQSAKTIPLVVFVVLLSVVPVRAGKKFKVSNYQNAHQIWFEAEDFDERNPEGEQYFPVVDAPDAFGRAISRAGGAGGMIRWTFDIGKAGGKGGTWYFWGRVIVPNNESDFMLVDGNPGDPTLPASPPFPGTSSAPGFTNEHRIFEENLGPPWTWGRSGHGEAHTKQLRDGENTMYIVHRQGTSANFWDVFMWTDSPDYVPTDEDYINAKPPNPGVASDPSPPDGATDIPRDALLAWTAGAGTQTRNVYFGTDFDSVNTADIGNPLGVLVGQGQLDAQYDPDGMLEYGQTYYWRIDEVNAAPDSTIFKGEIWSFTVEPFAYPIAGITATASSAQTDMGPENTVNGSGLDADGRHSAEAKEMWLSMADQPVWILYEFDRAYKLHDLSVWNSNQLIESFVGFGARDVTVEYSTDGATWTTLEGVPEFAQATAAPTYLANTVVDFGGVLARQVRLTVNSTWGGVPQAGLSEVQFTYVPVQAREPEPTDGATGVALDAILNWRPGREAVSHEVYLSADMNAVADGTAPVEGVSDHRLAPAGLEFGTTYFWKVDEVGEATTNAGAVWTFTTQEYMAVDDFEGYTDDEGSRIYETWIDGYTDGLSGSVVGYFQAPFAERTTVYGGKQSMPLEYNNVDAPFFSEAYREFAPAQDWTGNGADTLFVHFQGRAPSFLENAPGNILMGGGGADIWNTADQFRFVFKRLSGNGSIVARVDSIVNTDPWAKVGVMIRENLDPGSKFAAVYATPGNGVRYQARLTATVAAVSDTAVATPEQMALQAPVWVKIERTGDSFSGFYSTDGKTWTAMSWNPQTITMTSASVYVGLAVTSHNVNAMTTAEFSGVATTGGVTGAWDSAAIGVAMPSNTPAALYVVVEDSAGKSVVVTHPDPAVTAATSWQRWEIPLSGLTGVNVGKVEKLSIGVGDRANPTKGGAGMLYIDEIGVGRPAAAP